MRDAPVAIEKKAVERAIRPGPGAASGSMGSAIVGGPSMANIASQKKRILRSERERVENRRLTSVVKTHFRRLEKARAEGDAAAIEAEHKALVSRIDKAVQKGALHANTGARRKARAARIAAGQPQS
jgi:small subunit ribosomal protein S20